MSRPNVAIGVLLAAAGFASMTIMDSFAKSIDGAWPGVAVSALRFLIQIFLLVPIVLWRYGRAGLGIPRPGLQFARAGALAAASAIFFTAVMLMPLADATAIAFLNPLLVAMLAAIFLKERMPPGILVATIVAFAGVLIILRPNILAIGWPALLPLGSALCFSTYLVLNRLSAGQAPALVMQCTAGIIGTAMLAAVAIGLHATGIEAFRITPPSLDILARIGAMGLFGTLGHLLIFMSSERAPAPVTAPMVYTQIVMATLIGWWWFEDPLRWTTAVGVLLVIGCGLYVWRLSARGTAPPPREAPGSAASS